MCERPVTREIFSSQGTILKTYPDQQIVYGWASVISENGTPIIDTQGDVIMPAALAKAAQDFMVDSRQGKLMHKGEPIGEVVESIVLTKELQDALGIDLKKEGWFVGFKVHKAEIWKKFKDGDYPAFSIGGLAERIPMSVSKESYEAGDDAESHVIYLPADKEKAATEWVHYEMSRGLSVYSYDAGVEDFVLYSGKSVADIKQQHDHLRDEPDSSFTQIEDPECIPKKEN